MNKALRKLVPLEPAQYSVPRHPKTLRVQARLGELTPEHFAGLSDLEHLLLLPTLEELDRHPRHGAARQEPSVKTGIPEGLFDALPGLRSLTLAMKRITHVQSRDFRGLKNLRVLNLSGNSLKEVASGTFRDLPQLTNLNLENNALTVLGHGAFSDLPQLMELNLHGNRIAVIQGRAFEGCSQLLSLNLSYNQIRQISPKAVANIPASCALNFRGNPKLSLADEILLMNDERRYTEVGSYWERAAWPRPAK